MKTHIRKLGLAIALVAIATIGATTNVNAASKDAKVSAAAAIQQTDQGLAQFDSANSTTIAAITNEDTGKATQTANWTGIGTQVNISATEDKGNITANTKTGLMTNDTGNVNTGAFNGITGNTTHTANTGGTAEAGAHYHFAALFGGTGTAGFNTSA